MGEANMLVTWANPNSLEPVTKGGNSGITCAVHDHERAKSQILRCTNNETLLYFYLSVIL